jgi:hypothetical protein
MRDFSMSQSAVASLKMLTMDMVAFAMALAALLSSFSRSYISQLSRAKMV